MCHLLADAGLGGVGGRLQVAFRVGSLKVTNNGEGNTSIAIRRELGVKGRIGTKTMEMW